MSKINNKEVLQSYILTTAKYDYSVYEKRILYRLVELFQGLLQNQKLNDKITIEQDKQHTSIVSMPIKLFLQNETDTNHVRIKSAFFLCLLKLRDLFFASRRLRKDETLFSRIILHLQV